LICAACGTENEVGRKFCGECGQRLAAGCPSCGAPNAPGTKFCGECGTPLQNGTPAAPAGPATAPTTERRLVSVLFADLVGFTTLSEQRDAEDVRELLGQYFESSRDIIERYGGTVEKFIGDAVMAVWGTPVAQEDDAERAVRAALDLVSAVRQLGVDRDMPALALRAGVHTGEAVVTIGASGMGMVAGDLVNTASRLQSVAQPGTVLVGEGTQRAAGNAIVFEPAADQELKGKAAPVAAFRAVRVVAQRGGVGRSEGLEPPFVGRESELRLIKDFYHATAREQGPRLVSVIGQAGIGKSRLAWEFLKYIDGVTEIVHWHQGRSPAYGEGISFWALGEMVRMRIGIGESSDEETTRRQLSESLAEYVADADERRAITDPLLHLLGVGESSTLDRGRLFVAWRTFFERIADQGPVVMVFEDLQWADDGLLDFIEELITWSRGHSIYVITLARAELLDRRPTWGAGQRSFTSLNLSPLSDEDMRTMLDGLVPGLPEAVTAQIVGRAEGIPLYAVETVRMLLNDALIERDGDRFRPVGDLSRLAVPESLQALIAARIDALPPAERTVVQDAAVLGQSFALPAVEAVSRAPADQVEPMLRHLLQRELLTIDSDPRSPERGQYRFVQGLLREVAYGTLSRDNRRSRHLAAARYYETLGDDELSGVLAQHYVDAYQAHPDGPEGAAVAVQARVALRGAAQRAGELGSGRLAVGYYTTALAITADPAEELELRIGARDAAATAGILDVAAEQGRRVLELAAELGRADIRARGIATLGDILLEGHQAQARELLEAALSDPAFTPDSPGYIEVAAIMAKTAMRMGDEARAVELADKALPMAARVGMEETTLELLTTRAVALANMARITEATAILTGVLELARRHGMPRAAGRAAINLSYALAPDDPTAAFEVAQSELEEAKRYGEIIGVRYLMGNAGASALETGEWDWALEHAAEMEELLVEPAESLWLDHLRGTIAAYRGEDVESLARELYEGSRLVDDAQYRATGTEVLLIKLMIDGRHEELIRLVDETLELGIPGVAAALYGARASAWSGDLPTLGRYLAAFDIAPPGGWAEANRLAMQASIASLEGHADEARASFHRARATARERGFQLQLAMIDLTIVLVPGLASADRAPAAEEALEIFGRLGVSPLIERVRAAIAHEPQLPEPAGERRRSDAVRELAGES
jgi:class 3 adenylate cyclase/tetratricopeptide (TPR) repeat protein